MAKYKMQAVLISLLFLITCVQLRAQVSVGSILTRAALLAKEIEDRGGQILLMQVDHIQRGSVATQTYFLDQGSKYQIWVVGDDRIEDIDLCLYNEIGEKLRCDQDESNLAVVDYFALVSMKIKMKVTPFKIKPQVNDGFYAIIVARK